MPDTRAPKRGGQRSAPVARKPSASVANAPRAAGIRKSPAREKPPARYPPGTRTPSPPPGKAPARAGQRTDAPPLIAVDIGNTETVVGLFAGPELTGFLRLTSARLTADQGGLT